MYPSSDNTYIPSSGEPGAALDIDYVRKHGVIEWSDGGIALVRTAHGLTLSWCRVTLNDDGTIRDFAPYSINKYSRITPCLSSTR